MSIIFYRPNVLENEKHLDSVNLINDLQFHQYPVPGSKHIDKIVQECIKPPSNY